MMSLIQTDGLKTNKHTSLATFKASAGDAVFLPRIQLTGSNSAAAQTGAVGIGHYCVVKGKDTYIDVGDEVNCLVVAWRHKALSTQGDVVVSYDPESDSYKKIAALSNTQNSGCLSGPEFLLYLPDSDEFVTFHMASKSAKQEAPNLYALMHKRATLKSKIAASAKFKWQAPVVIECSTPFDIPEMERIAVENDKFVDPKEATKELVGESDSAAVGRER